MNNEKNNFTSMTYEYVCFLCIFMFLFLTVIFKIAHTHNAIYMTFLYDFIHI